MATHEDADRVFSSNDSVESQAIQELEVADALWRAVATKTPIPPPRSLVGTADLPAGYRVQALNVKRIIAAGQRKVGYKLALTSPAIQKQFGVNQPTSGVLLSAMLQSDNSQLEFSGLVQSRAEGEIAFEMSKGIFDRSASLEDVLSAVRRARPAIEIVNCRIIEWDITAFDFVADNSAAELFVLGDSELDCINTDFADIQMELVESGAIKARGNGAAVMGSPQIALHWLAIHLIEQGTPLEPGDIVMSGSLGPAVPLKPGDDIELSIEGTKPVRVRFS